MKPEETAVLIKRRLEQAQEALEDAMFRGRDIQKGDYFCRSNKEVFCRLRVFSSFVEY